MSACTCCRPAPGQAHHGPRGAVEGLTVERNLRRLLFPPGLRSGPLVRDLLHLQSALQALEVRFQVGIWNFSLLEFEDI